MSAFSKFKPIFKIELLGAPPYILPLKLTLYLHQKANLSNISNDLLTLKESFIYWLFYLFVSEYWLYHITLNLFLNYTKLLKKGFTLNNFYLFIYF